MHWWKSRVSGKGAHPPFDLFGQETRFHARKFVSRWETFPLDMRLVDLSVCVIGESFSSYVHSTYIHIYTYIFVTCRQMYTARARFIVLPINRGIHIFESRSDLYRLSFCRIHWLHMFLFRSNIPFDGVRSSFHRMVRVVRCCIT